MSFEPFLAFFLILFLRKSLRKISPDREWDKRLTLSLYCIAGLFIIGIIFHTGIITIWIWYALLLAIAAIILKYKIFEFAKKTIYAVLPLILLAFISDLLKLITPGLYSNIKGYMNFAFCVAITWMVATLVKSNKQQKALEAERKKTKEEEERSKFIAAQKDKLEILVNERTAELVQQKDDLQNALTELRETQSQLIHAEKMASLGELTAGIAHEIQNPLNFVNNFSEVNNELIEEMRSELASGNQQEAIEIADDIKLNLEKILYHGKRADAIVKGMLQHSRKSSGTREATDINALADEYLHLSYHGLRAKDKSFNATMKTDFDESLSADEAGIGKINIVAQDIGRVILNLINNAFYAVDEKKKSGVKDYDPTVSVSTKKINDKVEIKVSDNGNGIPQKIVDKIFQPFFTTKPTGSGTGLGLSLSYDIVKAHGGEIKVETKEGEGSTFIIQLPLT
ncbi:MAG TPA: ATP-binding protein [Hanamia sp.]|nr:ATP-binding protein [Hanamia sp.]